MSFAVAVALLLADGAAKAPVEKPLTWDDVTKPVEPNPFDQFKAADAQPEKLGPGPHLLLIGMGGDPVRIDYPSGAACQKARDAVLHQTGPRQQGAGVVYTNITAICVPK